MGKKIYFTFVSIFVLFFALATSSNASTFNYPDFNNTSGLNFNGNATVSGTALRLTPDVVSQTGSVWRSPKVDVANAFDTTFQFQIAVSGGAGADGMAFVIQNQSLTELGAGGSGMGYENIFGSLAVEIDTFSNGTDPSDNHISVQSRGAAQFNTADHAFSLGSFTPGTNMSDGALHTLKISYTPGTMTIFLDDMVTPVLTVSVNLVTSLGTSTALVGFTSATGGELESHDVLNWSFSNACIYSDNFNDNVLATDWNYIKLGWSETTTELIGTPTGKKAIAIATPAFSGCGANCTFNARMKTTGGPGNKAWMLAFYTDKGHKVEVLIKESSNKIILRRKNGSSVVKTKATVTIDPNVYYDISVAYDGSAITLSVDSVAVATLNGQTGVTGTVGFHIVNGSLSIDDLCVQ